MVPPPLRRLLWLQTQTRFIKEPSNGLAKVVSINQAASEISGTLEFTMAPELKSEISSIRGGEGNTVTVPSAPLDDVIPSDRKFAFVKVDVEGA
jgi:FkbM family methyltransferase